MLAENQRNSSGPVIEIDSIRAARSRRSLDASAIRRAATSSNEARKVDTFMCLTPNRSDEWVRPAAKCPVSGADFVAGTLSTRFDHLCVRGRPASEMRLRG
jgi:hypothetical protein